MEHPPEPFPADGKVIHAHRADPLRGKKAGRPDLRTGGWRTTAAVRPDCSPAETALRVAFDRGRRSLPVRRHRPLPATANRVPDTASRFHRLAAGSAVHARIRNHMGPHLQTGSDPDSALPYPPQDPVLAASTGGSWRPGALRVPGARSKFDRSLSDDADPFGLRFGLLRRRPPKRWTGTALAACPFGSRRLPFRSLLTPPGLS